MANRLFSRLLVVVLVVLADSQLAMPLPGCPFCTMTGQTLTDDVNQASMVLYGTLTNPRLDPNGDFGSGSTDLVIDAIVKKHDILGDQKVLTLPRYVPVDKTSKVKFLIFCDVFKGKIDPYKGVPVKTDDIVKYLAGAVTLKDKDVPGRLRFFFNWLDNSDIEISNDAYKEFGNADYKDFVTMAKELPADKVVKWLDDPNTPSFRFGLYASMLGHCGTAKHGAVLRRMLDDPQKRISTGVDGMLAGYALLQPKEGWAYLRGVLGDPKKEFMLRYAGLRAVRFFWEQRTNVVDKKELLAGIHLLLEQNDIADLAIEDLRKWKQCDQMDRILALNELPSHNSIPIVRRAILRFAMSCPENAKAAKFVDEMRKKDPDYVKDVEELLKLEQPTPTPEPKK
jgi:hypothetical protein